MKLTGDFWSITSRHPEAASQNHDELTWEVVRNRQGCCAVKIMLAFATKSVEFLTWGNCPVPSRRRAALFALCQSNAFFVSVPANLHNCFCHLRMIFPSKSLQMKQEAGASCPRCTRFQAPPASNTTSCHRPYVHTFSLPVCEYMMETAPGASTSVESK